MSIVKIRQGQPELRISLVSSGCDGVQLVAVEDIRLVITSPVCECGNLVSPIINIGCRLPGCYPYPSWGFRPRCSPHEEGVIVYPAWERSDDGEVVFRFDRLLWDRPSGRYVGRIEFRNGRLITELDIDLSSERFFIDKIVVNSGEVEPVAC